MHSIFLLLLHSTRAAKVDPLPHTSKRFLVIAQPRSGSTWLTKDAPLLARCPGVVSTGEALHPRTIERLSPQLLGHAAAAPLPLQDYTQYVRGVFQHLEKGGWNESTRPLERVACAGFKVLYSQLPKRGFGVESQSALKGFLKYTTSSAITVVHLVRLSQLERFISLEVIRQGLAGYHAQNGLPTATSRMANPLVEIDPGRALAFAQKQAAQNERVQLFLDRYCSKFGGNCLTMTHERLISDGIWAFAELRLAIFGGATACPPGPPPAPWVPCNKRVANWAAVAQRFNGTLWLDLCEKNTIPSWASLAAARHARARARVTRAKVSPLINDAALARAAAHLRDRGAFFDGEGQLQAVPPSAPRKPDKYKRVY